MNIEQITAGEWLEAEARAMRNAADKSLFKQIKDEVDILPLVQERLAFEFLEIAYRAFEVHDDVLIPIFHAFSLHKAISKKNFPDYLFFFERISIRMFELIGQHKIHLHKHSPLVFTTSVILMMLRAIDHNRFCSVLESLKRDLSDVHSNVYDEVFARVGRSKPQMETELQELGREINLLQIERENALRSSFN